VTAGVRARHRRCLAAFVLPVVGLIAGCSDDDGPAAESTISSTSSVPVASSAGTTSTSSTPTSTTTTSSVPPTTSTTPPTSTTTSPTVPPDTSAPSPSVSVVFPPGYHEMIAAFRRHEALWLACVRAPADCDRPGLDAVVAPGDLRYADHQLIDQLQADGQVGIPGPTPSYSVLVNVFTDDNTGIVTGVEACRVNGDIEVLVHNPDDPADDEVVDDGVISRRIRIGFEQIDGAWMATGLAVDETKEGNVCGPPDE
jgi:hypothetical protein